MSAGLLSWRVAFIKFDRAWARARNRIHRALYQHLFSPEPSIDSATIAARTLLPLPLVRMLCEVLCVSRYLSYRGYTYVVTPKGRAYLLEYFSWRERVLRWLDWPFFLLGCLIGFSLVGAHISSLQIPRSIANSASENSGYQHVQDANPPSAQSPGEIVILALPFRGDVVGVADPELDVPHLAEIVAQSPDNSHGDAGPLGNLRDSEIDSLAPFFPAGTLVGNPVRAESLQDR